MNIGNATWTCINTARRYSFEVLKLKQVSTHLPFHPSWSFNMVELRKQRAFLRNEWICTFFSSFLSLFFFFFPH